MLESEGLCASEALQLATQGAACREAHLKCFYTNVRSTRNKMNELEVLAQSQSYDIIGISETWWDESCGWLQALQEGQAG